MSDDEPTPEEKREAEALARALEGQASDGPAPPEVMETAAHMRYVQSGGALAPERAAALAATLKSAPRARPGRAWLVGGIAGLAAATALVIMVPLTMRRSQPAARAPRPSLSLLRAQANATRGGVQALAALDAEMRAYRAQLLSREARR